MIRTSRASLFVLVSVFVFSSSCSKPAGKVGEDKGRRGDALFLAEAPAVVPDEVDAELETMGISRLYVAGATLSASGNISLLMPPPPNRIKKPVIFVVMGEPGSEDSLRAGANGELTGESWGIGIKKALSEAQSWATVTGVHLHLRIEPVHVPVLVSALKALGKNLPGIPLSVTLPSGAPPESWKPLAPVLSEALIFSMGRRPETGDRLVPELSDAAAKSFPIPYRLLIVPGGYGQGGADGMGRRIPDGEIDRLSEDRNLDFDFGEVLSSDAGSSYVFKPRAGMSPSATPLAADGGSAKFRLVSMDEIVRFLSGASRWGTVNFLSRVFLVDGVPHDGHILGYPALRAFLTGKAMDPRLEISVQPSATGKGWTEFSIRAANLSSTPTDLSHLNNWVQIRIENGTILAVKPGDFDRFDLFSSSEEGASRVPFGRAQVCRLYENFYGAEEINEAGPIRISGANPKVYLSSHLTLPGGREVKGAEVAVTAAVQPPEPTPRPKPSAPPLRKKR